MTDPRCDEPGKLSLLIRWGTDGRAWLRPLRKEHAAYSLAQAAWDLTDRAEPRQLVQLHAAFLGKHVSMALVTDLTGDQCDFARSHHCCCTQMANRLGKRERGGTVWDNRGLIAIPVCGWEGALRAIGRIAVQAALQSGTNDPYACKTFFGPRLWGESKSYSRPDVALSDRTIRPAVATLALCEPDQRPPDLSRAELVHEAEAAIDFEIARIEVPLDRTRPFHVRRHLDGPPPEFSDDPRFIGPRELIEPLAEDLDAWLDHYRRCRDEFPDDQLVAFPRGTIRFRRLGAACDCFRPYRRPSPPRGARHVRIPPPVVVAELSTSRGPPR